MISLRQSATTAITGLKTNKMRSALTMLGIIIGIAAIIMVVSLGEGAQNLILSQVQNIGAKTIVVHPGREPQGPSSAAEMMADSLKEKDLLELRKKNNVPHLARVEPLNVGAVPIAYENETYRASILGASELIQQIYSIGIESGRFISEDDVKNRADVVVIGSKVREELFGSADPLGQKIKIKNKSFRIVGVMGKKGQISFMNLDEIAIVPWNVSQQYIFGIKHFHHFLVEADSEANVEQTVEDIKITLRNSHDIDDPSKDDFWIVTQQGAVDQVSNITNILTFFLAAVAAISLLVGGIGIMNIMLVSVTERTREIGLRKAIGATERDIMTQFLMEAVMLTVLGGVLGIFFGSTFSLGISLILGKLLGLDWAFNFPVSATFLGLIVSGIVGLIFGLYPARQAASKSPIEALRYE